MLFFSLETVVIMSLPISVMMGVAALYLRRSQWCNQASGSLLAAFICLVIYNASSLVSGVFHPVLGLEANFFYLGFAVFAWRCVRSLNSTAEPVLRPALIVPLITSQLALTLLVWTLSQYFGQANFLRFSVLLPGIVYVAVMTVFLMMAGQCLGACRRSKNALYAALAGVLALKIIEMSTFLFVRETTEIAPLVLASGILLDLTIAMLLMFAIVMEARAGHALPLLAAAASEASEPSEMHGTNVFASAASVASNFLDSPRQLRMVLGVMGEGVLVCSVDGTIILSNQAAADIFSLRSEEMHSIADDQIFCFLHEDGSAMQRQELPFWKTLDTGISQRNNVIRIACRGGQSKCVYLSTDPIFSDQHPQQIDHVVISIVDISSLKLAEKNLREREAVLATVFQLVPDTLTITKISDGRYIDVNRNWEPLSGFTREEALGRRSSDLHVWFYPEQRAEFVERIFTDGEVRGMTIAFRHKKGHAFQCRVSGSKFETGDGEYLLLSCQNIDQEIATEKARGDAERISRENEQKYWTIFQLSPIPLGLIRMRDSSIVEVNDSWVNAFGYARDEVVGRTALDIKFWYQPEMRQGMIDNLLLEGQVDRFEALVSSKSGDILTCLLSARSFTMNGDAMFIFSMLDVTRQYQIEKEIREMTAQLEDRVYQRTLSLEQTNTELATAIESLKYTQNELIRSEKMAALGALVAGVAHELNTPIGNSVTVASTLQDKTRELLNQVAGGKLRRTVLDQYLENTATGTEILMRSLGTARDLIGSFKQVAVDQSSSQRRKFDLKNVLKEIIATLSPMYKKGPYSLHADLGPNIMMDSFPGPLGQIITNFLTNALSHGFEGRETGKMQLTSRLVDQAQVEIIFSDDGVGISEIDQRHVFDPFFTTKLGQGGSGLGMNIAYNITTGVLGGTIRIETQLGQGTSFILLLPLVPAKNVI